MPIRYIIQARTASTRLPDKILMPVGDRVLIQHIIDRLLLSGAQRSEICFALADEGRKDLHEYLDQREIPWVVGETNNVLARYVKASDDMSDKDVIVRLTGDNPFLDYKCLREYIKIFESQSNVDFSYPYKLPLGMGYEAFTRQALLRQMDYPLLPHHLEHVTVFIKEHKNLFNIRKIDYYKESPDIRLTIDYPEDIEQARVIYNYFKEKDLPDFCSDAVFKLRETNPDFFSINQMIKQKESTDYERPKNG